MYVYTYYIKIFEIENLMDLHTHRAPESKNHAFSGWSVCLCACLSVISINQKQIIAEILNLLFQTCVILKCHLKLFLKNEKIICVQRCSKEFEYVSLWMEFVVSVFQYVQTALYLMKFSYTFGLLKNMQLTDYAANSIHILLTELHKRIQISFELWLEIAESAFQIVLHYIYFL